MWGGAANDSGLPCRDLRHRQHGHRRRDSRLDGTKLRAPEAAVRVAGAAVQTIPDGAQQSRRERGNAFIVTAHPDSGAPVTRRLGHHPVGAIVGKADCRAGPRPADMADAFRHTKTQFDRRRPIASSRDLRGCSVTAVAEVARKGADLRGGAREIAARCGEGGCQTFESIGPTDDAAAAETRRQLPGVRMRRVPRRRSFDRLYRLPPEVTSCARSLSRCLCAAFCCTPCKSRWAPRSCATALVALLVQFCIVGGRTPRQVRSVTLLCACTDRKSVV